MHSVEEASGAQARQPVSRPTLPTVPVRNVITEYYNLLPEVIAALGVDTGQTKDPAAFAPGYELPELDDDVRWFFEPATVRWNALGDYHGVSIDLLDLTGNPCTQTTKTAPSLLIVARAVEYIRRTGEPILIFTPTSGNKGTALRDAVHRALEAGLVDADQLRVVILAPESSKPKLRSSGLDERPEYKRRNPVLLYPGSPPGMVKTLGGRFVAEHGAELKARFGVNVWYSLALPNYLIADAGRAFVEYEMSPPVAGDGRIHVHAVSSAYGLLGYSHGRGVLERRGGTVAVDRPGFLLVQHLGAPDMVLNLLFGDFNPAHAPAYRRDPATGLFVQDVDPRFPAATHDPDEILDPTFYTREPPTSPQMNELIARHGGGGIVVSLHECLERYPLLASMLAGSTRPLPSDPRALREWSLVMALTGALNAVDRGVLRHARRLVVHGSGSYAAGDYLPLPADAAIPVTSVPEVLAAVEASCRA